VALGRSVRRGFGTATPVLAARGRALARALAQARGRGVEAAARCAGAARREGTAAWAATLSAGARLSAQAAASQQRAARVAEGAASRLASARAWAPAPRAALAAAGVLVVSLGQGSPRHAPSLEGAAAPALALLAPLRPTATPAAPAAPAIRVHVNARPWARIRVDGVDVGPTPLSSLHVEPGAHDFEAEFADGRTLTRRIEISAERRFVSLP
jgi:hypothetical protein